jgi:hypothetical protein
MASALKTFPCSSCGSVITMRAYGLSISFVCESCGNVMETGQDGLATIVSKTRTNISGGALLMPLGSRGIFEYIEWEVIGFMRRQDIKWKFSWDEYLLFNPYEGFRFLIKSEDHFAFAEMLFSFPEIGEKSEPVTVSGTQFSIFHKGVSVVTDVAGEFYWRVRVGEQTAFADYIAPPQGCTIEYSGKEKKNREQSVSIATYLSREEVFRAFNLSPVEPLNFSSAFPFQPNPYQRVSALMWLSFFTTVMILCFAQISLSADCSDQKLLEITRDILPSERDQEITIGEVTLTKPIQNIAIRSHAPVSNSWVEVEYELESVAQDESAWISQPIEFYFGYDSDGSWSEGSTYTRSIGGTLTAKTYKVLASVDALAFSSGETVPLSVQIWGDVPVYENLIIAILLLLIPPALVSFLSRKFERDRWAESDFSPYDD